MSSSLTRGPVRLTAKQRRLLAALAIRVGETRSPDLLIDAVWGEAPPASASNLLQVYVSQVRKALPTPARIITSNSGYALEVAHESLDAARFECLLEEGRVAASDGNPELAASLLRRALGLWGGQAYGEFAYEEFARAEAERLEELRLLALEERLEAELALGQHADLLPELQSLAATQPLRERLQAQMMRALYGCGRQREALELYADVRARLREDLGLEPGGELRELQRRILRHDATLTVAPSATEAPAALPTSPNELLGRGRELDELRALLVRDKVRLVVLTGTGGSGKTRLALEAARETALSFANGVCFVDLAPLRDPGLVVGAIAQAVHLEAPGPPLDALAAALQSRELLLIIDNAEHVRAAAPVFVELLARARRLTLLVTSRVVLHVSGEHVYPVEPLAEPDAVTLFHERARESELHFRPDSDDEHAINMICERLEGLPLAIELAASRIRTLTPAELLSRLEPRLPLLTGGLRDRPTRQQTLRATLAWSFDLLNERERRDLCRLSVFVGGCTLEAAEAVCGAAIDGLASLVDHNLLQRTTTTTTGSRYSMLETIREFASERLKATGKPADLRDRHAQYFLELTERAEQELRRAGPSEAAAWLARLEADYANLQRAIDRFRVQGRRIEQARLVGALAHFWARRGYSTGAPTLVEEALTFDLPADVRANLLQSGYHVAARHRDSRKADEWCREGLELSRAIGDVFGVVNALIILGWNALGRDELEAAERWLSEGVAAARESNDVNPAYPLTNLARVATQQGDYGRAWTLLQEALELVGRDDLYGRGAIAGFLARNAAAAGDHVGAAALLRASIQMFAETGTRAALPWAICALGGTLTRSGDAETAARLIGAAEAADLALYGPASVDASAAGVRTLNPADEAVYAAAVSETRAALAEETFERLREEGRRLTIDEMLHVAHCTKAHTEKVDLRSPLAAHRDPTTRSSSSGSARAASMRRRTLN